MTASEQSHGGASRPALGELSGGLCELLRRTAAQVADSSEVLTCAGELLA